MKKVKILTITLATILIILIAFAGIYVQNKNKMENKVKDYSFAIDLDGKRNIRLSASGTDEVVRDADGNEVSDADNLTDEELTEKGYTKSEEPINSEDVKTAENYRKAKKVYMERLQKWGVGSYNIKLDEESGDIVIEIPENDNTDDIISQLEIKGKFEFKDSETGEVLLNNDDIAGAKVLYNKNPGTATSPATTSVFLSISFTEEGAKKLENMTTEYKEADKTSTNTTSSENTTTDNTTTDSTSTDSTTTDDTTTDSTNSDTSTETEKQVTMVLDDTELTTTSFEDVIKTGELVLTSGESSKEEEIQKDIKTATNMAIILNSGSTNVKYEIEGNEFIQSDITDNQLLIAEGVIVAIGIVLAIILIVKYKSQGLLAAISYVGCAAILTLLIRYTNTILSIEGMLGVVIVLFLNYMFINKLLAKLKGEELNKENIIEKIKETNKEFFITIIPVIILAIVFTFIKWSTISSFGMVMFWGIVLLAIYNYIVTSNLLKIKAE